LTHTSCIRPLAKPIITDGAGTKVPFGIKCKASSILSIGLESIDTYNICQISMTSLYLNATHRLTYKSIGIV